MRDQHAFTFIELLIVVTIIALLIALLPPFSGRNGPQMSVLDICEMPTTISGRRYLHYPNDINEPTHPYGVVIDNVEVYKASDPVADVPRSHVARQTSSPTYPSKIGENQ
ncbi:MAG: prepilin-type N-terminal cleavage/methylation domain-containing protein [Planctomycetes bacterium]|nr:prepilin-type N-terminal cleavage/methylation domain-containing protein [Planctomycetota bacterium]